MSPRNDGLREGASSSGRTLSQRGILQSDGCIPECAVCPAKLRHVQAHGARCRSGNGDGNCGNRGAFLGKPVFSSATVSTSTHQGVYRIHSNEDCKRAVQEIFTEKKKPTLRDIRIFLKAIDNLTAPYEGGPLRSDQASARSVHMKLDS